MTRIAVAGFQHETNTFAPFPTTFEMFERAGAWPALTRGDDIPKRFAGLNLPLSGFLDVCRHDVVPILWAFAEPGGYVTEDAFERIAGEIVQGIERARPDAVYLDLHGAMVTEAHDDAEAEILSRIRESQGDDLPIAVSLDLHANASRRLFDLATVVTIYRTYPHTDIAQTGARACALLEAALLWAGVQSVSARPGPDPNHRAVDPPRARKGPSMPSLQTLRHSRSIWHLASRLWTSPMSARASLPSRATNVSRMRPRTRCCALWMPLTPTLTPGSVRPTRRCGKPWRPTGQWLSRTRRTIQGPVEPERPQRSCGL